MSTATQTPALPYPLSETIRVYRDDGKWGNYRAWFMRRDCDLASLSVCQYRLRVNEDGDVDLTAAEWAAEAARMHAEHPGCLFIYTAS